MHRYVGSQLLPCRSSISMMYVSNTPIVFVGVPMLVLGILITLEMVPLNSLNLFKGSDSSKQQQQLQQTKPVAKNFK